jgi:hypothetical protein
MSQGKTKVYIYTRVSTTMQIDGYSLDAQKARMKAYADFNDYQIVGEYEDARAKKQAIEADKVTGDNIYKVLVCFEKLYNVMNPLERKKLMEHLISEIQIYPERQPNGQWLKSIKFRLPIVENNMICVWTTKTSVYKGYKQDKIEMRGDRAEMSDFPLYLNTVAGGLDRRDQTIGGFSFVVKIYALPVVEIIG